MLLRERWQEAVQFRGCNVGTAAPAVKPSDAPQAYSRIFARGMLATVRPRQPGLAGLYLSVYVVDFPCKLLKSRRARLEPAGRTIFRRIGFPPDLRADHRWGGRLRPKKGPPAWQWVP